MKKIILLILFIYCAGFSWAQTGKDFWFVAPDLTPGNGDQPIYLRVSTGFLASTVTVSQPANSGFTPLIQTLAPNSTYTFDLTSVKSQIENGNPTPDIVENKGLHITGTENISTYYEVIGTKDGTPNATPQNGDIWVLRGAKALGTRFYTPFQNILNNASSATPFNLNGINPPVQIGVLSCVI